MPTQAALPRRVSVDAPDGWFDRTMIVYSAPAENGGAMAPTIVIGRDALGRGESFREFCNRQVETFRASLAAFQRESEEPGRVHDLDAFQIRFTGAATVAINFGLAGYEGEKLGCSALSIKRTSPDVFIGGPSANDPRVAIQPEVPGLAVTGLQVLGIAGALMALPYSIVALGVGGHDRGHGAGHGGRSCRRRRDGRARTDDEPVGGRRPRDGGRGRARRRDAGRQCWRKGPPRRTPHVGAVVLRAAGLASGKD